MKTKTFNLNFLRSYYKPDELPDEEFFEFLKYSPDTLFTDTAKTRILRWRKELHSEDKDVFSKAQDNLRRIGSALAFKGRGKPLSELKENRGAIVLCRYVCFKKIKEANIQNFRSNENKRQKLKELFRKDTLKELGDLKDLQPFPKNAAELADTITAMLFKKTSSTVKQYCKGMTSYREFKNRIEDKEYLLKLEKALFQ